MTARAEGNPAARRSIRRWLVTACVLALLLALPLATNDYTQYVANLVVVDVLVAVGFNIVIGYLGQIAFANAALFGLGAYCTGILLVRSGLPYPAALAASGLLGAFAGTIVALPARRGIRFFYLGILTMAIGELLRWSYIHADRLTGGSTGLEVPVPTLAGMPLQSQASLYYVFLAICILLLLGTRNLLRSRIGRAIIATRENELATAALGIPTAWYFVLAFAWSGLIVGIAGGMFAVLIGRVIPESFNLVQLVQHFAFVIVGGVGSLMGSILGAVLLTIQPELFRGFPGMEEIFSGLVIVFVLVFLPGGLAGLATRLVPGLAERYYRGPRTAAARDEG